MKRKLLPGFILVHEITERSKGYEQGLNCVETEVPSGVDAYGSKGNALDRSIRETHLNGAAQANPHHGTTAHPNITNVPSPTPTSANITH